MKFWRNLREIRKKILNDFWKIMETLSGKTEVIRNWTLLRRNFRKFFWKNFTEIGGKNTKKIQINYEEIPIRNILYKLKRLLMEILLNYTHSYNLTKFRFRVYNFSDNICKLYWWYNFVYFISITFQTSFLRSCNYY